MDNVVKNRTQKKIRSDSSLFEFYPVYVGQIILGWKDILIRSFFISNRLAGVYIIQKHIQLYFALVLMNVYSFDINSN